MKSGSSLTLHRQQHNCKVQTTIWTMPVLPFWVLNVVVALLSMQGQKALGFHKKYLNLLDEQIFRWCSEDERRFYDFGTTWGWVIKGALSDFCQTMFIFESPKTNTPIPQQDLALILKSPPPHVHTQPWRWRSQKQVKMTHKHIQTKANTDNLCETKQNQRYSPIKKKQRNLGIRFEPFSLLEFSPPLESCSDIYAGPTSCLIVTLLFNVLFLW